VVIEHSRHGGQSQSIPNPSRLLPNVAVMSVLGISPCRILCDLLVYDFQGCDLQGACDGCQFDPATSNEKLDLGRATGFRVNPNDDAYSAKNGRPASGVSPLFPHCFHFVHQAQIKISPTIKIQIISDLLVGSVDYG
jgi:hypothetical protein